MASASLFLAQNAYHAGPIAASQTALVLVDPLASLAIGIGLFGDNLRTAGAYGPLEALSLVIMFAGAASIAHSPLISGMKGDDDRYAEMLSLRSRSKRLIEAVQDTVPSRRWSSCPLCHRTHTCRRDRAHAFRVIAEPIGDRRADRSQEWYRQSPRRVGVAQVAPE